MSFVERRLKELEEEIERFTEIEDTDFLWDLQVERYWLNYLKEQGYSDETIYEIWSKAHELYTPMFRLRDGEPGISLDEAFREAIEEVIK